VVSKEDTVVKRTEKGKRNHVFKTAEEKRKRGKGVGRHGGEQVPLVRLRDVGWWDSRLWEKFPQNLWEILLRCFQMGGSHRPYITPMRRAEDPYPQKQGPIERKGFGALEPIREAGKR